MPFKAVRVGADLYGTGLDFVLRGDRADPVTVAS